MNRIRVAKLILCGFSVVAAVGFGTARGAEFNDEQFQTLDGLVGSTLSGLHQDSRQYIGSVAQALREAYDRSVYGRSSQGRTVQEDMVAEGEKLKARIASLEREVAAARPDSRKPATMILLLSKEQTVSFEIYKWCRSVTELTDLANASSGKEDHDAARFQTLMMSQHELIQDTLGMTIQGIAKKFLGAE